MKIQSYWDGELGDIYPFWYQNRTDWDKVVGILEQIVKDRMHLNDLRSLTFLDCACGGCGEPAISLAKRGFRVIASDGSKKMLNYAIEKSKSLKDYSIPNFVPYPLSWSELYKNFGPKKFDIIICAANSICHLPPNETGVLLAIQNMYKVMKDGGLCFITTKRYSGEGKELIFDGSKEEWLPRTKRDDGEIEIHGEIFHFVTFNEYPEKSDGTAKIILKMIDKEGKTQRLEFPFWTISAEIVEDFMLQVGFNKVFIYEALPPIQKYDICMGVRQ